MARKGKKASLSSSGKTFSQKHGSKSPMLNKHPAPIDPQALQPVNPPTQGGSPMVNPGEPGHYLGPASGMGEDEE
jgi:hypothetical protein